MTKQYISSIKNSTNGSWLKSITTNSYTHTLLREERLIFKDKNEAESTLKTLQSNYTDTFTLVIETPIFK